MAWPQVVVIVLFAIGLGIHLARHGTTSPYKWNFGTRLVHVAIWASLLWAGGFWG